MVSLVSVQPKGQCLAQWHGCENNIIQLFIIHGCSLGIIWLLHTGLLKVLWARQIISNFSNSFMVSLIFATPRQCLLFTLCHLTQLWQFHKFKFPPTTQDSLHSLDPEKYMCVPSQYLHPQNLLLQCRIAYCTLLGAGIIAQFQDNIWFFLPLLSHPHIYPLLPIS